MFFFSWELNAWSYCCLIYFVSFIAVLCHCHFNIAVLLVRNDWLRHWLLIQKCCFFSKPSLWLQVRWTEMLRAQKAGQQEDTDHKKKQSVWKLCVQLVKNHLHVFILVLINAFFYCTEIIVSAICSAPVKEMITHRLLCYDNLRLFRLYSSTFRVGHWLQALPCDLATRQPGIQLL